MSSRAWYVAFAVILFVIQGCSTTGDLTSSSGNGSSWLNPLSGKQSVAIADKRGTVGDKDLKNIWAMARLSERRGQSQVAREAYLSMIERAADDPRPYHRLAIMNAQDGHWENAKQLFEQALQLAPSDADLLGDAGYFYYLIGEMQQAETLLTRAVRTDPTAAKHSNNLAILLGENGRYDESLDLFRRNGSEAEAFANLGFVLAQRGDVEQAVKAYSQALTLDDSLQPAAEALVELARHVPKDSLPIAYVPARKGNGDLDTRLARVNSGVQSPDSADARGTRTKEQSIVRETAQAASPFTTTPAGQSSGARPDARTYEVAPVDYVSLVPGDDLLRSDPAPGSSQPALPELPAPDALSSDLRGTSATLLPIPYR